MNPVVKTKRYGNGGRLRRASFLGYIHKLRTVSKLLEDIGFSHTTKSKQLWKVKGVK